MSTQQRILYIEDDESAQIIGKYALETIAEQNVQLCNSGYQAVSMIRKFKPDLILLDVVMPEIDGIETLKLIRAENVTTPIIFMTAKDSPTDQAVFSRLDAIGIIAKPFDLQHLWKQIQSLVEKANISI